MIYLEQTDPADAKPGDFMFCQNGSENTGLNLCLLIVNQHEINIWHKVTTFYYCDHESDIVDGKPTSELIARFSGSGGKRFERDGETWINTSDGIVIIGKPRIDRDTTHLVLFSFSIPGKYDTEFIFSSTYDPKENMRKAETERARLIEWLETGR